MCSASVLGVGAATREKGVHVGERGHALRNDRAGLRGDVRLPFDGSKAELAGRDIRMTSGCAGASGTTRDDDGRSRGVIDLASAFGAEYGGQGGGENCLHFRHAIVVSGGERRLRRDDGGDSGKHRRDAYERRLCEHDREDEWGRRCMGTGGVAKVIGGGPWWTSHGVAAHIYLHVALDDVETRGSLGGAGDSQQILPLIPSPLEHWGKIQWLNDGDMMHASEIGKHGTRDMTHVKVYFQLSETRQFNGTYGQLRLLLVIKLEPSEVLQTTTTKIHLLAVVAGSVLTQKNRLEMPHTKGTYRAVQIIDAEDLEFVVGRVPDRGEYIFVERVGCASVLEEHDDPEKAVVPLRWVEGNQGVRARDDRRPRTGALSHPGVDEPPADLQPHTMCSALGPRRVKKARMLGDEASALMFDLHLTGPKMNPSEKPLCLVFYYTCDKLLGNWEPLQCLRGLNGLNGMKDSKLFKPIEPIKPALDF
ncbi:hypothetical protein DFH09DRAFT_1489220 [Mycena vulgaris]|nr:hypothetical protein DFH09DRAFT_1489220 [Mycena vulgaris]